MKHIFTFLLTVCITFSLAGCGKNTKQEDAYRLGEHLFSDCTIDEIVEKLGSYQKSYRDYSPKGEICSVTIYYDQLKISLKHPAFIYNESYIPRDNEDGTIFTEVILTENDRKIPMKAESIQWAERVDVSGPRGIKIGDSLKNVKAKFYDLSDKYDDKTIYQLKDIYPDGLTTKSDKYDSVHEKIPKGYSIGADEVLCYYAIQDLEKNSDKINYESVAFYFVDGKLILIIETKGIDET